MANDSPFFLSKVECPICKTVNEFETVRVGAYVEKGRDTDFSPIDIQWRFPRYQAYHPLTFFTATCSNCFYTREFNNSYRDWQKDMNFRTYRLKQVKDRHLEMLAASESIVKALGGQVDLSAHPNESAVLKLHLAVLDEQAADHPNKLDLARFYLRIGWVFRELEKGENPNQKALRSIMHEIEERRIAAVEAITQARRAGEAMQKHLSAHFEVEEIPAGIRTKMVPHKEPLESIVTSICQALSDAGQRHEQLESSLSDYTKQIMGGDGTEGIASFAGFASFAEYLLSLRPRWDAIVSCEQDALRMAARHYREAFEEGREIAPGYQQIQASYLIAELSRRTGDFDTAREFFNSTIKHGQDFVYRNRNDRSRTALARKILELAMEQGRLNMEALKSH